MSILSQLSYRQYSSEVQRRSLRSSRRFPPSTSRIPYRATCFPSPRSSPKSYRSRSWLSAIARSRRRLRRTRSSTNTFSLIHPKRLTHAARRGRKWYWHSSQCINTTDCIAESIDEYYSPERYDRRLSFPSTWNRVGFADRRATSSFILANIISPRQITRSSSSTGASAR